MPIRPCAEASCPHPATYRGRCREHSNVYQAQTHRNKSFYNSARWKRTSLTYRVRNPFCVECLKEGKERPAQEVDHIVPIEQGGDRWSWSNLRGLCKRHHSQITWQQTLGYGSGR